MNTSYHRKDFHVLIFYFNKNHTVLYLLSGIDELLGSITLLFHLFANVLRHSYILISLLKIYLHVVYLKMNYC